MKKRMLSLIIMVTMAIVMTGCSFSIGTKQSGLKDKDYDEIFTEQSDENGIHKHLIYDYKLETYGQMQIAVDTSNGHSFEIVEGTSNFRVKDKNGTEILYGGFMPLDQYQAFTAELDEIKRYNERDFFVMTAEEGTLYDAFSYMADCGVDCGMVLETKDEENLKLVAFGGVPVEGSSSDIVRYKGQSGQESGNDGQDTDSGNEIEPEVMQPEETTMEEPQAQENSTEMRQAGSHVYYTKPRGFTCDYTCEYFESFSDDTYEVTFSFDKDEVIAEYLTGATTSYYDIYDLTTLGTFDSQHGSVTVVEGISKEYGNYIYYAVSEDGVVNAEYSRQEADAMTLEESETLIGQFVK